MLEALIELRQRFSTPQDPLALSKLLRDRWPAEQALWLQNQLKLYWDAVRLEAFAEPLPLLFESQGLQMATRWPLARRKAEEFRRRFPDTALLEIGAGIGGDTLELGRLLSLRSCEQDPQRTACLKHNLTVSGLEVQVLEGDGLQRLRPGEALYLDPARRDAHQRRWKDLQPDPTPLFHRPEPLCVKLAPGIDETVLPVGADLDYVSHQGTCKEAVLWLPGQGQVQACMWNGQSWLSAPRGRPPELAELAPGDWLHEPDPAALRAQIWQPREGRRIDATTALLVTPPGVTSPWTQTFEVLEIADADLKQLKRSQRQWGFHPLEIKKRGFDLDPEQLRKKLPACTGGGAGVLFLTRVNGRHRAIWARRVSEKARPEPGFSSQ